MALTLGILFGIIAMIGWGVADFLAANAVRKSRIFNTLLWIQLISTTLFVIIFLLFFDLPFVSLKNLVLSALTGFILVVSVLAFYKGLKVGKVSVISPIAASAAVIAVFLSIIFFNEKLNLPQSVGISLAILGAILVSFKLGDLVKLKLKKFAVGVEYALVAMLGWGVLFILVDILVSDLGWFIPLFLIKIFGTLLLLIYAATNKRNFTFPKETTWIVISIGVIEVFAFIAYGIGINTEFTSIIAPIISAFPAVTIILARIFFKEILELNQKIGIITVLAGLVLLAM